MPPAAIERHAPLARFILYAALGLWSLLLFAFSVTRLIYTTRTRNEPSLNGGYPFYEPAVVELFVCSILGAALSFLMIRNLRARSEHETFSRNWFEVIALGVLSILWLGGAAAATSTWSDLNFCIRYAQCRLLQSLLAWAWLGWFTVTALFIPTAWLVFTKRNWDENLFDAWGEKKGGFDIALPTLKSRKTEKPPKTVDEPSPSVAEPELPKETGIAGGNPPPTLFQRMAGKVLRKKPPTEEPTAEETTAAAASPEAPGSPEVPGKESIAKGKSKDSESPV